MFCCAYMYLHWYDIKDNFCLQLVGQYILSASSNKQCHLSRIPQLKLDALMKLPQARQTCSNRPELAGSVRCEVSSFDGHPAPRPRTSFPPKSGTPRSDKESTVNPKDP